MRTLVAAAATAILATGLAAQEKDEKFESAEGKYAAAFPAKPKTESKKAGSLTMHTAAVQSDGVAYMVIYADLPADTLKTLKAEEVLENGEKGLVNSFKAKVTDSKNTTFGPDKYPAREVKAEVMVNTNTVHLRLKLILVNNRMYQVLTLGNKEQVFGKPADKFYESFEIKK